jgi:hypothetical protein
MSRLTPNHVVDLMEAYNAVYAPQVNEDYLWESYLTEEFISEAYQTVADYLVYNGFVPGYNTAEVYMSEMAVEDIDSILFETGVLNEQYLMEAGFFQNAANTAIGSVRRAGSAVAGGIRSAAGGADRAVGGAVRAGQTAVGAVKRAGNAVAGGAQRAASAVGSATQRVGQTASGAAQRAGNAVAGGAQRAASAVGSATQRVGQTASGAAQRAGAAVQKAVTPVAQAVQGTAQRAVSAGQSALGGAARAVQGAGQAVVGGAQRAAGAVAGAAGAAGRRIGQEVEISRKVGAGEPLNKPTTAKPTPPASTGGMSAQNLAAYKSGGGNAAAQRGMGSSTAQVIAQGKKNLGRMDQGSGRSTLTQSFDPFDVVLGHLIDEGYADTEDAALQIMANMSEEWRQSIVLDERNRGEQGMSDREVSRRRNLGGNTRSTVSSDALGDHGSQGAIQKFHNRKGKLRQAIHKSGRNTRGDTGESGGKGRYEANKDHTDGYPSITKRGQGPG